MEIPIEIPVETTKPKRRAVPPRFAAMTKAKETPPPKAEEPPKVESKAVNEPRPFRHVRSHPVQDSPSPCSLEEAEAKLTPWYPEFAKLKETIETNPKWQDKVQAMNSFSEYLKEHGKEHPEVGEAAVVFAKHASKNFKAANMNVLKCSLDCVRAALDSCGAGKRVCSDVILCCVPKIHDRKLGSDVSDLFMLIGEIVHPNQVIASLTEGMAKSKVPAQCKAALQILYRLASEFGANALDVQSLFAYLTSEHGFQNPSNDVKSQATELLCLLHRHLGPIIARLLQQSDLPPLQLKSLESAISSVPFDATLTSSSSSASSPPSLSLAPSDITAELTPLIAAMRDTAGKDSWKRRQQAVLDVTALLRRRAPVANSCAIAELVTALKDRFTEPNLNLRAKALLGVSALADALGDSVSEYPQLGVEMLRCVGDRNKSVTSALLTALRAYSGLDRQGPRRSLNVLMSQASGALKDPRGRELLLRWLVDAVPAGEAKTVAMVAGGVKEAMRDRSRDVRELAGKVMASVEKVCGDGATMQQADCADGASGAGKEKRAHSADGVGANGANGARRRALANRPGARVLVRRPAGNPPAKRPALSPPTATPAETISPTVESVSSMSSSMMASSMTPPAVATTPPMTGSSTSADTVPREFCETPCNRLLGVSEMLLTQRELQSFTSVRVMSSCANCATWWIMAQLAQCVVDVEKGEFSSRNGCLEAIAKMCRILGVTDCVIVTPAESAMIGTEETVEMEKLGDALLHCLATLLRHVPWFLDHQDTLVPLNILNGVLALCSSESIRSHLSAETISELFLALILDMTTSQIIAISGAETPFRGLCHHLLALLLDMLPLPRVLPAVARLPAELDCSKEETTLLLRRALLRLLARINGSQLDDATRRTCVSAMKRSLPAGVPESLRREFETCWNVLEPVSAGTGFGDVLRSANQMLGNGVVTKEGLTTSALLSQMELFKQRYRASRKEEKREETREERETAAWSEKEREQDERMRRIREKMSAMRRE